MSDKGKGGAEFLGYFFRKKDPNRPTNNTIKAMHIVNKISIVVFILGIMLVVYRKFFAG